jgi:hypothetical protein
MSIVEKHLIKINIPEKLNSNFNFREKHINIEIQKNIDSYNDKGYMVVEKSILNKTSTHATVRFMVQKLVK